MRPISGFEGEYSVNPSGVVWSHKRSKMMRLMDNGTGYKRVALRSGGSCRYLYVHRLVAQAFLENHKELPEVNHKDGDKANNNVNNLEWCTRRENVEHAIRTGLFPKIPIGGRRARHGTANEYAN